LVNLFGHPPSVVPTRAKYADSLARTCRTDIEHKARVDSSIAINLNWPAPVSRRQVTATSTGAILSAPGRRRNADLFLEHLDDLRRSLRCYRVFTRCATTPGFTTVGK
jgi:hypothetical protein